ncbi:N-acetyldiaminopimelate deacetylase [Anatilimnocola aggregata]|uniref:N-acetyldiaminopimelate deacetylase n=1 Tax=Anatilimnocola aggregata TaxID=2528021 RepID=A0A517YI47_9BACT|nr:amidohydrolase [Anatilimnocola aggregata]QDU29884.1 N-acetyldiaminopimelate deacetylase [Anatilimnocola aggregata]
MLGLALFQAMLRDCRAKFPLIVAAAWFTCGSALGHAQEREDSTTKQPAASSSPGEAWARKNLEDLLTVYQHFHRTPELSFQEKETAATLAKHLREAGLEVTENVGGYGVVGVLKNGAGRTVMVRTDLDALPVKELTGLAYASQVMVKNDTGGEVGVMHACGHDIHITNAIAVARFFAAHKSDWKGTLVVIGQPAEERGSGARKMLADKLFERFPKPDYALALHCDSTLAAGRIGIRGGYILANVDSVDITVRGRGGHGAMPHTTVDPIVQAAELVVALQTIVSREIKPTEPAVITVGSIHGGTKHNIIGDTCHLQLTVRSYTDKVRAQLREGILRKAKGVALAAGAPEPIIEFSDGTPATFNDESLALRITQLFRKQLGEDKIEPGEISMGGEDFSEYGRAGVPILMYRLGAVNEKRLQRFKELGQSPPSLHSPLFYPDADEVLVTAVSTMTAAVQDLFSK